MADCIEIDYDFSGIMESMQNMVADIEKLEAKATLEGAKVVKTAVEERLNNIKSDIEKEGYTHMADDVKISGYKNVDGEGQRVVKGGKKTGYKWKFLELGTTKMSPKPFVTQSIQESKEDVKKAIENEVRKVLPK